MKIVSTTLMGQEGNGIVVEALESVADLVDEIIVIGTHSNAFLPDVLPDRVLDKLVCRSFEWRDDFAAARNFALEMARENDADWAITVDTDERLEFQDRKSVAEHLWNTQADLLLVLHQDGSYAKERFIRCNSPGRWEGATHECFAGAGNRETIEGVTFRELAKTAEQYRAKFVRDVKILLANPRPKDPRWQYYMAESYKGIGDVDQAIVHYRACERLYGWDEEAAWACYQVASLLSGKGKYREAIEWCGTGIAHHSGVAELPWLAGWCCFQLGNFKQATYWSRLAIVWGEYSGEFREVGRIGFRHPPALWEAPYQVLMHSLRALGRTTEADEVEELFDEAYVERTKP